MDKSMEMKAKIFRPEALHEYINRDQPRRGDVLRIAPRWTTPVYWLLLGACLVGLISACFVNIDEHATGPALLIRGDAGELTVLAFLPGHFRPLLEPGMPLTLDLNRPGQVGALATVESVSEDLVGPAAARRLAGPDLADTVDLPGPVVVVRARLTSPRIASEGRDVPLYGGLQGIASLPVRSERLIVRLVPRLGSLFGERHG